MARKLAANVYVGETLYKAGTSPEKDIADQITNPKAWEGKSDGGDADPVTDPPPPADDQDVPPAKKAAAPKKRAAKKTAAK